MNKITIKEFIQNYNYFSDRVYLYGASVTGQGILRLLEKSSIKVEAFIDRNPDKCKQLFRGHKVILPQEVDKDACVIITTSSGAVNDVNRMLTEKYGIKEIYYFELESIMVKHLFFIKGYDASKAQKYEEQYQQLMEQYDSIVIYPMWADRIGEFIGRYMIFQVEVDNKPDNQYCVMLPYVRPKNDIPYANTRLMDMISRQLPVIYRNNEEFWAYAVTEHITEMAFDGAYIHTAEAYLEMAELQWERALRYPKGASAVVNFSEDEKKEAQGKARKLGIREPFVCVFARDSSYLMQRPGDFSYHDYRDGDINNFKLLADYLKTEKIQVVRVGTVSSGKLDSDNVVDVTNDNYDELLDLYVNAKCSCWVGGVSGAEYLSGLFRKKKLCVNAMLVDSYDITPYCNGLSWYIPKLYFSVKENRYLSLQEMLELDLSGKPPHLYKENFQVDIIENCAEDILDFYKECEQKENGTWEYTEKEKIIQEKYQMVLHDIRQKYPGDWKDYAGAPIENHLPVIPIGSRFLEKYESFLLREYID